MSGSRGHRGLPGKRNQEREADWMAGEPREAVGWVAGTSASDAFKELSR